jgi:hypothetical protein
MNKTLASAFVAPIWLFIPLAALAQDTAPSSSSSDYVSRAEYDKLKAEHEAMKQEMEALKTTVRQMANGMAPATPAEGPAPKAAAAEGKQVAESDGKQVAATTTPPVATDELRQEIDTLKTQVKETFPGTTKFLVAGYGTGTFEAKSGEDPFFDATFNAFFLWKLSDRLLFEGEVEFEFEDGNTTTNLEIAQASYLLNDYMTLGVGRFLNPMNYFVERQHMGWVNKFPDKPLAVYDGLLAESEVGFQVRGGVPVGPTKFGYAFYVANAPELRMDTASIDASDLGTLEFDNFDNVGKHVAVGGHVGFLPIPEFEIGYGFQFSDVAPPGSGSVNALLQSADVSYVRDSEKLKGIVNLKAQWVWSHVDNFTYDPGASVGGPFAFKNNRDGGYAQIAYRPSRVANSICKNLEPVFRYDILNQGGTLTGVDERRYTVGLNYWLGPSTVVKAAYEFDHQQGPNADRHNAVLVQFATGF